MKKRAFFTTLILATILLVACKKYEEGPTFSLRSKTARVAGNWTLESYTVDGQDQTSFIKASGLTEWQFTKEGNYTIKNSNPSNNLNGKWEFEDNEEKLKFTQQGSSSPDLYTILRLRNNSMWLESKNTNNNTIVIKLKQ
jgi:hypothetical protein